LPGVSAFYAVCRLQKVAMVWVVALSNEGGAKHSHALLKNTFL